VANCCCENSQVLIRIEVHLVTQVAMLQNHVHSLAEISCMSLIMVSNIFVTILDRSIEIK